MNQSSSAHSAKFAGFRLSFQELLTNYCIVRLQFTVNTSSPGRGYLESNLKHWCQDQFYQSCQIPKFFFKWAMPGLFFFSFIFSGLQLTNKYVRNIDDVGIRTADLWCRKRPLCQLRHNHGLSNPKVNTATKCYVRTASRTEAELFF